MGFQQPGRTGPLMRSSKKKPAQTMCAHENRALNSKTTKPTNTLPRRIKFRIFDFNKRNESEIHKLEFYFVRE